MPCAARQSAKKRAVEIPVPYFPTARTLVSFEVVLIFYFGRVAIFGPLALPMLALIAALLAALLGLPFRRRRLAAARPHAAR